MSIATRKIFDTRVFAAFTQLLEVKIEQSTPPPPDTKITISSSEQYISIYPDITVIVRSSPVAPFISIDML